MRERIVRPAEQRDSATIQKIYAYYVEHSVATFELVVPDVATFEAKRQKIQERYPFYVVEEAGEVVGYAYAHAFYELPAYDWTAEVTIYLAPEKGGKGTGSALYEALERTLSRQGIRQVMACITASNEVSIHFHQKRGYQEAGMFQRVGYKKQQWLDVVWYSKTLQAFDTPVPLMKWSEVE